MLSATVIILYKSLVRSETFHLQCVSIIQERKRLIEVHSSRVLVVCLLSVQYPQYCVDSGREK